MSHRDDLIRVFAAAGQPPLAPGALDGEPVKMRAESRQRRGNDDARALTIRAAARKLGIALATLRRLIDEERIRVVPWVGRTAGTVPVGGRVRIPANEVERVAQEGIAPEPQPDRSRNGKGAQPKPRARGQRIRDLPY